MKRLVIAFAVIAFAASSASAQSASSGWGEEFAATMARGDSHMVAMEYARALDAYERAAKLAPHAVAPQLKCALALYKWGNAVPARRSDLWPSAVKRADRARFLDPTNADAAFLAGVLRYRMGDYKSAVEVYKSIERVRQGDVDVYLDLAVAASRAGDRTLAQAALEKARAIDPASKRLYSAAAEVLGRP